MNFRLVENSNKYRRLKRALFGDTTGKIKTFAIISPENPLGWEKVTEKEFKEKFLAWTENKRNYNSEQLADLKATLLADTLKDNGNRALKYGHFDFIPIKGSYGDKEKTLLILNLTLNDAKVIARDYGQESFFYGVVANTEDTTSKIGYYVTSNACKTYDLVEVSDTITFEDEAEDFFSKFGFKYRINMNEFGDEVTPISDTSEFEESMDENRTFMSRAHHRRNAYSKSNDLTEKYEVLTEANLNRIVNGHDKDGYAIISACRQDAIENPKNDQQLIDENNKRTDSLKKDLHSYKFSYIPVFGGYKEMGQDKASVEKSFIVFPFDRNSNETVDFDEFQNVIIELGKKYNQDSVLIKAPNESPMYYICAEDKFDDGFVPSGATLNDVQQSYFTALKKWDDISLNRKNRDKWVGNPQRFTYSESYLNKSPMSVMEATRRGMSGEMFYFGK